MKSIYLFSKPDETKFTPFAKALQEELLSAGLEIKKDVTDAAETIVCLGGDGSLLATLRRMGKSRFKLPVLGIHASRGLGFLHPVSLKDIHPSEAKKWASEVAQCFLANEFRIRQRWGLEIESHKAFKECTDDPDPCWALNDVVISKGPLSRLVTLRISVDGTVLWERLRGDGIIVASAVGSTAYSLSAGGPVVHPDTAAMVLTPICPHEIAQRPVVIDGHSKVEIELLEESNPSFMTRDGQVVAELLPGKQISVTRSADCIKTLVPLRPYLKSKNYYERLREKLGLGASRLGV